MTELNARGAAVPGSWQVARSPVEIIDALDLGDTVDVASLSARKSALKAVHMGERDLPIGTLLDLIKSDEALCPPRTGHIGNWGNIERGRAGVMDFNKAICGPGYGYPLLYCFTQTEADEQRQGDWGYLPGSLIDGTVRTPLQLHAWDGEEFIPCSHAQPRFVPFLQTRVGSDLVPLIELHACRLGSLGPRSYQLEQSIFSDREEAIRRWLHVLIEDARRKLNPRRALQDLISHAAALDGSLTRCELALDGKGYKLGQTYYPSTEALVEHALTPFHAVARPREFMAGIGRLPWQLPVVSNLLISVLSAALQTHLHGGTLRSPIDVSINLHLHWGGRDMAGYPPRNRGYLLEDSKVRSLRRICTTLAEGFSDFQPICFALLPAAVFMLCPSNADAADAEMLSDLFSRVSQTPLDNGPAERRDEIERITRTWLETASPMMSRHFLDRFGPRRGGLPQGELPPESNAIEPAGFRELTLRQASTIVGALYGLCPAGGN